METDAILSARGLVVGYADSPVLKNVSIDFQQGALTAIIGPNGCGKSTLLKTLARVLTPTSGQVLLQGRPLSALPTRQIAKQLAHLPQGPVAPDGLTLRELVMQGRYPHLGLFRSASETDTRIVEEALEATGLQDIAGRPVNALSGGQRQRAWIAMTLAQDTGLILMDEPTTYLDLRVQIDVMRCLQSVARSGRSLIVVLHELNLAAAFADRVVMMRDGAIVADGSPAQTFTPPLLSKVFGLDAQVIADPQSGRPVCLPRMVA